MKTLKVITGVLMATLVIVYCTVDFDFSKKASLYEDDPADGRLAINAPDVKAPIYMEDGLDIGDKAPAFELKDVSGKMVSLKDYKAGRGVVLIFTCNHCPYSKAYEDRINEIDRKYKYSGYPVVAINPNNPEEYPEDSFDNMKKRATEKNFTFPYLFDYGQKIYPQYGATKTPHVYLLNKEKDQFIVRYIGAIDDNYKDKTKVKNQYLQDAIKSLMDGREIKTKRTKAIGCSIKR